MEKTVRKIEALPKLEKKLKVAAYARVSCDKDAMLQSLAAQVSHYNKKIKSNDKWIFAGVYADESISGTKDNRKNFQRLINDCNDGKINMIITKSISRFARNVVTLLAVARDLKRKNIDIYFEEQELHSISEDGELILTFLATFAQEEARQVSENQKWRIRKEFEEGRCWGYKHCLGYAVIDKKYVILPQEADLVKHIYNLYLNGCGDQKIANILNKEGYIAFYGKTFARSSIAKILTNISYTGDMLLQKTYRENHMTKRTLQNKGQLNQYYCENSHEPIISKEDFQRAQELRTQRISAHKTTEKKHYTLGGLLKCGLCGKNYFYRKTPYKEIWMCRTMNDRGVEICPAKQVPQSEVYKFITEVLDISEFDEKVARDKIATILVKPNYVLEMHLKNGTTVCKEYSYPSIASRWTPEMRELARQRSKKQIKKKGANGQWQKLELFHQQ